jgi:hypothetical protein
MLLTHLFILFVYSFPPYSFIYSFMIHYQRSQPQEVHIIYYLRVCRFRYVALLLILIKTSSDILTMINHSYTTPNGPRYVSSNPNPSCGGIPCGWTNELGYFENFYYSYVYHQVIIGEYAGAPQEKEEPRLEEGRRQPSNCQLKYADAYVISFILSILLYFIVFYLFHFILFWINSFLFITYLTAYFICLSVLFYIEVF